MKNIAEVVDRQSFARRKANITKDMPYGDTIQHRLMRKGVAGDWRNHFTRELAREFHEYFFDTMKILKQEEDENWWKI